MLYMVNMMIAHHLLSMWPMWSAYSGLSAMARRMTFTRSPNLQRAQQPGMRRGGDSWQGRGRRRRRRCRRWVRFLGAQLPRSWPARERRALGHLG